jgi:hypothetical protein
MSQQVFCGLSARLVVIQYNRINRTAERSIHGYHWGIPKQSAQLRNIRRRHRYQNDPVHLGPLERCKLLLLQLGFLLMGEKHGRKPVPSRLHLNGANGVAVEDIVDVWKQDAKRLGASHAQAPRQCIRFVPELRDGNLDPPRHYGGNRLSAAHMAGDR